MADLTLRPLSWAKPTLRGHGQTDVNDPEQTWRLMACTRSGSTGCGQTQQCYRVNNPFLRENPGSL
jgi:hypothetical protein